MKSFVNPEMGGLLRDALGDRIERAVILVAACFILMFIFWCMRNRRGNYGL